MGLERVREKKLLYHLTKVTNMETIINCGLLSRRYLQEQGMFYGDVADPQIISKRKELGLDRYTPFHFHPYSAFDVAVKNTYLTEKFVYICIRRALAELFQCVYVPDEETKLYIEKLFEDKGITEQPPYVSIQPKWF